LLVAANAAALIVGAVAVPAALVARTSRGVLS